MPSTFQALWVIVFALLPGALYTWAYEREVGSWGINLSDRLLRFVGMSVIFHALAAPITYEMYRRYVYTGALSGGRAVPVWLWGVALLYAAIPIGLGWLIGMAAHQRKPWTRFFVGPTPAPSAWEHFFATPDLGGWMRLRMKSGEWIVGTYTTSISSGLRSYAAGHGGEQDIYLAEVVLCDPQTGIAIQGSDGNPQILHTGILVRWSELSYLEYIRPQSN